MFDMNTNVIALGVALTLVSAVPAGAQTIVDMSLVSCDQFLKSPKPRRDVLSSWVGGYYGATHNVSMIDARYVARNSAKVATYCKTAKKATLMSAVEKTWR
jgi:acid stress chaperone HdeB